MLEIKANKDIYLDDEKIELESGTKDLEDFLISMLNCKINLEDGLTIGSLIEVLSNIKTFISSYTIQEFEVGKILIESGKLLKPASYINVIKETEIVLESFLKLNVKCEIYEDDILCKNVKDLKVILDECMLDDEEIFTHNFEIKSMFTLIELIEVVFEDFIYSLKTQNLLV